MDQAEVLVLGIGNLLWADEGFGVRAVEALNEQYQLPEGVELVDGGTQGLYLLPMVKSAKRMIVFDAVDYRMAPGTLKVVLNEEVPAFLGANKMSLHQTGFQEVLALAQLSGEYPEEVVLIGVQPETLTDFGGSLTNVVKARIPEALSVAIEHLTRWGFSAVARTAPLDPATRLNAAGLDMAAYEAQRPAPDEACRIGDARFLNTRAELEKN